MSDTSKREELIEEAAKAMFLRQNPNSRWEMLPSRDMHRIEWVEDARRAWAVFEQAHTPTDDEREALEALDILHRYAFGSNEIGREQVSNMVEIISDRLRRTAVQEPSADEVDESAPRYQPCHFDTSGMYVRTWCHTHGYDHLTPDGDVYVQGFDLGDGKTYTGPVSQEDLFGPEPQGEPTCCDVPGGPERCGDCPLDREPQGEPSDAITDEMVERGLKVSREFPMKRGLDNARNVMRAVLEAALRGS